MLSNRKTMVGIPLALSLMLGACSSDSTTPANSPTSQPDSSNSQNTLARFFDKQVAVFGVQIFATANAPDAKVLHAANIMAEYLDNNEDGIPDNQAVVDRLVAANATLIMPATPEESEALFQRLGQVFKPSDLGAIQDLYASETHPNGAQQGRFDGALEEVLHLITHVGFSAVYPSTFGERVGATIADAMDVARGGQFLTIPQTYPQSAWYTYDDETCDYSCMVTEYTYWALTSILGGQSFNGRLEQINNEWRLNTRAKVENQDNAVFRLLTDQQYGLPSSLPDGTYSHRQFTITKVDNTPNT